MKKILLKIFYLISRIIYSVTPKEFYKNKNKLTLKAKIIEDLTEETYKYFKDYFKKSLLFESTPQIRKYAIEASLRNYNKEFYYLEFGVWKGESANFFSRYVKKLYAFDSFQGLEEDWIGTYATKGEFNLNKKIPKLNSNIETVIGMVEETLDIFLKKHNPKVKFIHMDMDTYKPTKFVLKKLKPYLVKDAIILFDEYFNYVGWKSGEFKAFNEVFKKGEYQYQAFTILDFNKHAQVVIKVL